MKQRRRLLLFVVILLLVSIPLTIYLAVTSQFIQKRAEGAATVALYLPTFPETYTHKEEFTVNVGVDTPDMLFSSAVVALDYDQSEVELTSVSVAQDYDYLGDDPSSTTVKTFSVLSKDPQIHTAGETLTPATLTFRVLSENTPGTISLALSETSVIGVNSSGEDETLTVQTAGIIGYHLPGPLCRVDMCTAADSISFETMQSSGKRYAVHISWDKPGTGDLFYKVYRNSGSPVPDEHPEDYFVALTSAFQNPSADTATYVDTNNGEGFIPDQELFYDIDTYRLCTQ